MQLYIIALYIIYIICIQYNMYIYIYIYNMHLSYHCIIYIYIHTYDKFICPYDRASAGCMAHAAIAASARSSPRCLTTPKTGIMAVAPDMIYVYVCVYTYTYIHQL